MYSNILVLTLLYTTSLHNSSRHGVLKLPEGTRELEELTHGETTRHTPSAPSYLIYIVIYGLERLVPEFEPSSAFYCKEHCFGTRAAI